MQMIDVLTKLREIASRSPEEIGRAIAAAEKMSGTPVTEEMTEKQKKFFGGGKKDDDKDGEKKTESKNKKPDADGDGVPDWADKKPGKDDNEDKKKVDEDISITLSGSDAVLAEILKLAGQIGAKTTKGPEPMGGLGGPTPPSPSPMGGLPGMAPPPPKPMGMPSSGPIPSLASMVGDEPGMGDGPDMDFDMGGPGGIDDLDGGMEDDILDDSFDATTTPSPKVMGIGAAIPSGNDLSKPKMTAPRVSPGDNPLSTAVSFD